jgi:hypothetical protein
MNFEFLGFNFTTNGNYTLPNGQNGNGIPGFDPTYYIYMTLIPLLVTTFTTCIGGLFRGILGSIIFIFAFLVDLIRPSYYSLMSKIYSKTSIIIKLTDPNAYDFAIDKNAKPIIWYINKKCNNIPVSRLVGVPNLDMSSDNSANNKMFVPVSSSVESLVDQLFKGMGDGVTNKNHDIINKSNYSNEELTLDENITMKFISPTNSGTETMLILSTTNPKINLQNYLNNIVEKEYRDYMGIEKDYRNKLFVYNGLNGDGTLSFNIYNIDKSQTFENIFFEQKNKILDIVNKLQDVEYFKKRGIKRKVSLLFSGLTGVGKTTCATAIGNQLNRPIIMVPISRVRKNREFERIMYGETYGDYKVPNSEKIILFDELDSLTDENMLKKVSKTENDKHVVFNLTQSESKSHMKENNADIVSDKNDDFNIGMFLSFLDGAISQDGMIFIATAYDTNKLDSGLYRDGRLTNFRFTNIRRQQICLMIEKYYDCKLTDNQVENVRDDALIQNLSLKNECLRNLQVGNNVDECISNIGKMEPS